MKKPSFLKSAPNFSVKKRSKFLNQRGTLKPILFKINFLLLKTKSYILKTLSSGIIKWKTFFEINLFLKRHLKKKKNNVYFLYNTSLNWAITRKKGEKNKNIRMGKGKGAIEMYVSRVSAGIKLLEIKNLDKKLTKNFLIKLIKQFPLPCKMYTTV